MKIVLCGSKRFVPKFFEVSELLKKRGFDVVIPYEFLHDIPKKEASLRHFREIDEDDVDALLIINDSDGDLSNYIGANTFAELAFGFYKGKQIYLLNDMYEPYLEELLAWDVKLLKGDLEKIKS